MQNGLISCFAFNNLSRSKAPSDKRRRHNKATRSPIALEFKKGLIEGIEVDVKLLRESTAATVHGLDYVLTWNCKHIANAQIQKKLAEISTNFGYKLPTICTPYELMGD